jgi:hypothetical protein
LNLVAIASASVVDRQELNMQFTAYLAQDQVGAQGLLLTQIERDTKPLEAALDAMLDLVARLSDGS